MIPLIAKLMWVLVNLKRQVSLPISNLGNYMVLRAYRVKYGKRLVILGALRMSGAMGKAKISIGDDVTINNRWCENPTVTHPTLIAAKRPGAVIEIGNRVGISGAVIVAWSHVRIGDDVLLGGGCMIVDTDFHGIDPEQRVGGGVKSAPVIIERNAWIGARAIILKGVTIGSDAVVAAGAVVTKDVAAGAIVAGVPARLVGWAAGGQRGRNYENMKPLEPMSPVPSAFA